MTVYLADHLPHRPSWNCVVDGQPWPCDPAREQLAATLSPHRLSAYLDEQYADAAEDLPTAPIRELHERFLAWPPRRA